MEAILPSMEDGPDAVERIVGQWRAIRPELDATPLLVIGRLQRLAAELDERLRPPFAAAGLANGDFDLLATLRRQAPSYAASPGELAAAMLVTTGATTKRIDRLEQQGLVTRRASATDGRGRVIKLTAAGRRLVDRLIAVHLANEAAILEPLGAAKRAALADLLAELTTIVEGATQRA